ncbi:unnamed protein product [Cylindrotheca closterium]|uniref:NAD(P)(+)--arginine ADP-ribosyltransferase n=2 Tax=Cylindrotheca closterium TaxID=2856 RepID=A0AAD2JL44_9STRA|nr:unnamed protein product [Cylindrotheca closterium]
MTRRTPVRRSALSVLLDDASSFIHASGSNDDYGSGTETESGQRRSLRVAQRAQPSMGSGWNESGRRYSLRVARKEEPEQQRFLSSGVVGVVSSSWSLRNEGALHLRRERTASEEEVSDSNSIDIGTDIDIDTDWSPSSDLESRRMSNVPLSLELYRARAIYLAKRERRRQVVGQLLVQWKHRECLEQHRLKQSMVLKQVKDQWSQRECREQPKLEQSKELEPVESQWSQRECCEQHGLMQSKVLEQVKNGFNGIELSRKKIDDWLQRPMGRKQFRQLTKAIKMYTGKDYAIINSFLRSGRIQPGKEKYIGITQQARRALNVGLRWEKHLKVFDSDKTLYRGSGSIPMKLEVGGTLCDKGFFSTSQSELKASAFLNTIDRSQTRILFAISRHCSGVDVSEFSKNKHEAEVLFAPDTMFRVIAVDKERMVDGVEGTVTVVEIQEMEQSKVVEKVQSQHECREQHRLKQSKVLGQIKDQWEQRESLEQHRLKQSMVLDQIKDQWKQSECREQPKLEQSKELEPVESQWSQRECCEQHGLMQSKVLEQVKNGFNGIELSRKKIDDWLQRPMGRKQFRQLTKAIKMYTGKDYAIINSFLRSGRIQPGKEKYIGITQQARRALNVGLRWEKHLKVFDSDKTLYRGSGSIPMKLEVGGTLCDKGFFSTSQSELKASAFLNTIDRSQTRILFAISRHCSGVDVSEFSKNKHEAEVLFAPDTMFRVIAVDKERMVDGVEGTVTVVEIQEMEQSKVVEKVQSQHECREQHRLKQSKVLGQIKDQWEQRECLEQHRLKQSMVLKQVKDQWSQRECREQPKLEQSKELEPVESQWSQRECCEQHGLMQSKVLEQVKNGFNGIELSRKKIDDWLQRPMGRKQFRQLTKAIKMYTGKDYAIINSFLRSGRIQPGKEKYIGITQQARRALNVGLRWEKHLKVFDSDKTLYRGSGSIPMKLEVGGTLCDKGFFSTSQSELKASAFLNTIDRSQTRILFAISRHCSGVDVSEFSKNKHEAEVLFAPDTMFRVIAVDKERMVDGVEGTVTVVEIQEMEQSKVVEKVQSQHECREQHRLKQSKVLGQIKDQWEQRESLEQHRLKQSMVLDQIKDQWKQSECREQPKLEQSKELEPVESQWSQRESCEQHGLMQSKVLEQVKNGFNGIELSRKKIDDWLQRPMGRKQFRQLTKAIKMYTGKDYAIINSFLRSGRIQPGKEKYIGITQQARRALNVGLRWEKHLKVFDSDKTLYRGSGSIPMKLEVGGTLCDKGFFSTSQSELKASAFLNTIDRSQTRILFAISRHCSGVDVSEFSKNKHEAEVLFAPDTMFRVIAVDKERMVDGIEGTVTVVEIQEMEQSKVVEKVQSQHECREQHRLKQSKVLGQIKDQWEQRECLEQHRLKQSMVLKQVKDQWSQRECREQPKLEQSKELEPVESPWSQRECCEQHRLMQSKVLEQVKNGFNGIELSRKKIDDWLQRPMGRKQFRQLTKAIKMYTGKDYAIINSFLRSGRIQPGKEKYIGITQQARRALNVGLRWEKHLKVFDSDKTLYRGSGSIPMKLEVGGTLCDKGFFSTSQSELKASAFLNTIDRSQTRILFAISRHCSGVDVSEFSKNKHEAEVLFAPDTMFRVIAVDKERMVDGIEGTVTVVEIQEIV